MYVCQCLHRSLKMLMIERDCFRNRQNVRAKKSSEAVKEFVYVGNQVIVPDRCVAIVLGVKDTLSTSIS